MPRPKLTQKQRAQRAWSRKKYTCAASKIEFSLDISDFEPPEFCPVLGIALRYSEGKGATANTPSIDRIDPNLGYTKDNVIVVSNLANSIKNSANPDQIIKVGQFYKDLYKKLGIKY